MLERERVKGRGGIASRSEAVRLQKKKKKKKKNVFSKSNGEGGWLKV